MRNSFLAVLLLLSGSLLTGCCNRQALIKGIASKKTSLAYIHQPKSEDSLKTTSLKLLPVKMEATLPVMPEVRKVNGYFIPVVLLYCWKKEFGCELGQVNITEDIEKFTYDSFIEEADRRGKFSTSGDSGEYTLELSVTEIKSVSSFREEGILFIPTFYFYFNYFNVQQAGPSTSTFAIRYKLKKGNDVIAESDISDSYTEDIIGGVITKQNLKRYASANMVESLSFNIKNVIEKVVLDINRRI